MLKWYRLNQVIHYMYIAVCISYTYCSDLGPVRDGQAEVIVTGLQCGVRYNITAEGRMSTSQAFVGFAFASTTTLPCAGKIYVFVQYISYITYTYTELICCVNLKRAMCVGTSLYCFFFPPIFLSSNSFIFYLLCSIFCSRIINFAQH